MFFDKSNCISVWNDPHTSCTIYRFILINYQTYQQTQNKHVKQNKNKIRKWINEMKKNKSKNNFEKSRRNFSTFADLS